MFSITALLASLPPASMAESDLARFVSRALGRRIPSELPGLRALLDEEPVSGYPPSVGPILAAACERLAATGADPRELEPSRVEALLSTSAFLAALEARIPLERQILRPGVILTSATRDLLRGRLHALPGVGPQLVCVAPVTLVRLPGVRFVVPRGPLLARPMTGEEADRVRAAWSAVEEVFPLDDPESAAWEARFVRVALRDNRALTAVVEGLRPLALPRRRAIWREVVEHLRDQEVVEEHRPGARGLDGRLTRLGFEPGAPWVEPLLGLAQGAFEGAAPEPEVARGACRASEEELALYAQWVEVPVADRERIAATPPAEIERDLRELADVEAHRLDVELDADWVRALRALRDRLLRPRQLRSAWALDGVDPLLLAEARLAAGHDASAILAALDAIAEEAMAAGARRPASVAASVGAPVVVTRAEIEAVESAPIASQRDDEGPARDAADGSSEPEGAGPVEPPLTAAPAASPPAAAPPAAAPPRAAAKASSASEGIRPPRFSLPPLPAPPPPRPKPRTRPRIDFPPMPSGNPFEGSDPVVPPPSWRARPITASDLAKDLGIAPPIGELPAARAPEERPATSPTPSAPRPGAQPSRDAHRGRSVEPPRSRDDRPPSAGGAARSAPGIELPVVETRRRNPTLDLERGAPGGGPQGVGGGLPPRSRPPTLDPTSVRRRPPTVPHLVTPRQGEEFYDSAFKELQILERDILQRGPWPAARERVDALEQVAYELASALGPSARSGDRAFSAALHKVEMVQAYLERVRAVAEGGRPVEAPAASDDEGKRRGGLRGLFRRKR